VYITAPAGAGAELAARVLAKARFHFDAEVCQTMAEAVQKAHAGSRRGLLVCGSEAAALEAETLLAAKAP